MDFTHHPVNIQSKDHEKLLNVIDDLRSQGISRFIDLPQIIVCGDQSSGKSSVLEAVSGLKFPTHDSLCTRFCSELILRRSLKVTTSVSIVPDASHSDEVKIRLKKFKTEGDICQNLGKIIKRAGEAMGLDGALKNFSSDVLRIELSGPGQPHLTLVDLPGLFHSGSKSQSDADAEAVKALVTSYMAKSRSIILAVISAKNDFNNQIVTKFAKEYDPEGIRTLGIITKPDTLPVGSDSERQFLELAENKDVNFVLGWHVVKNRTYEQRDCSNDERNKSEIRFFSKGIWTSLSPSQVGIEALRPRLSKVLQDQILRELPGLMKDVDMSIRDCQLRLQLLGASRSTHREQRMHLHSISNAFTTIIRESVQGPYHNEYFGDSATEIGYIKRIRAKITNMQEEFVTHITSKGHMYEIISETEVSNPASSRATTQPKPRAKPPYRVTKQKRIAGVKELIKRNRGKELATTSKEENVTALFREQSSPWVDMVRNHASEIFEVVRTSVHYALEATCNQTTREGVLSQIVNPGLIRIKANFDTTVDQLLRPHTHSHPVTYNHYLTENLQNLRNADGEERLRAGLTDFFGHDPKSNNSTTVQPMQVDTKQLLLALMKANEPDMLTFACTEALNTMEAYYKVCRYDLSQNSVHHN